MFQQCCRPAIMTKATSRGSVSSQQSPTTEDGPTRPLSSMGGSISSDPPSVPGIPETGHPSLSNIGRRDSAGK